MKLEKLNKFWLEGKDTWDSNFDFGSHPDDYDRQFDDYKTIAHCCWVCADSA